MVLFFCAQDQSNSLVPLLPWSTYFSMWRTSSQLLESRSAVEIAIGRTKELFTFMGILAWGTSHDFLEQIWTYIPHPTSFLVEVFNTHSDNQTADLILISPVFPLVSFSVLRAYPFSPRQSVFISPSPPDWCSSVFPCLTRQWNALVPSQSIVSRGSWFPCLNLWWH